MEADCIPEFTPTFRLQWEEAQDCFTILYPEGMVRLNRSSGEILRRCDGTNKVTEIVRDLEATFPDTPLADDVRRFLDEAENNGWIRAKRSN